MLLQPSTMQLRFSTAYMHKPLHQQMHMVKAASTGVGAPDLADRHTTRVFLRLLLSLLLLLAWHDSYYFIE